MFSIKHMGIHGDESVFEAAIIIRDDPRHEGSLGTLEFYNKDHDEAHKPIVFGRVFVMNESGRTVSAYDLGGWEFAKAAA
jgi:hypothetical protein